MMMKQFVRAGFKRSKVSLPVGITRMVQHEIPKTAVVVLTSRQLLSEVREEVNGITDAAVDPEIRMSMIFLLGDQRRLLDLDYEKRRCEEEKRALKNFHISEMANICQR